MFPLNSLLSGVLGIINKMVPDPQKQAEINLEMTNLMNKFMTLEAKSDSWLTRNWRPWMMFSLSNLVLLWGVHECIIRPYLGWYLGIDLPKIDIPSEFWHLLTLGFGVYGGARSVEKIVDSFIKRIR